MVQIVTILSNYQSSQTGILFDRYFKMVHEIFAVLDERSCSALFPGSDLGIDGNLYTTTISLNFSLHLGSFILFLEPPQHTRLLRMLLNLISTRLGDMDWSGSLVYFIQVTESRENPEHSTLGPLIYLPSPGLLSSYAP